MLEARSTFLSLSRLWSALGVLLRLGSVALLLAVGLSTPAYGQSAAGTIAVGSGPYGTAVNPVTNKI